jgi:MFS family permease
MTTALHHLAPALRRYLGGALLVRLADEGARVALVLLAVARTGGAGAGGLLLAALLVPHVVAAPAVGLLTDRAERPGRVVAVCAAGFAAALTATAAGVGHVPIGLAAAVLLAGGACGPALTGGLTSRLSDIVPESGLARAFGLDSLSYNVAGIAGPAMAGVVASVAGAGAATVLLASCAAAGGLLLAGLPGRPARARRAKGADREPPPAAAAAGSDPAPSLAAGARAIAHDRVLAAVTAASALGQLGPGAVPVVAAVVAAQAGVASASGWLVTAVAAGGLLGSVAWTWRPAPRRHAPRAVMAGLVGVGLPLAAAAAGAGSLVVVGAFFAASGCCLGPFTGALFTTRQDRAPERVRGQVFTLGAGLKTSAAAAGAALAGLVAGWPPAALLLTAGATPVLAGVLGAVALPRRVRSRAAAATRPAA